MISYEESVEHNEETVNELAQEGVVVMHEIDDIFRLSKYHEVGLQAFGEAV
jgi:4-hydroxy-3-methylbut-2-enyl diphosphate reductase IspH